MTRSRSFDNRPEASVQRTKASCHPLSEQINILQSISTAEKLPELLLMATVGGLEAERAENSLGWLTQRMLM